MPSFKMQLPNGQRVAVQADSAEQALQKVQDFLGNGGSEFNAPAQPQAAAPVAQQQEVAQPDPQVEAARQAIQASPLGQSVAESVGRFTDPTAQATTAATIAPGMIGGTKLAAMVGGGALGGFLSPAEDMLDRFMNTVEGAVYGVVLKPVLAVGAAAAKPVAKLVTATKNAFSTPGRIKTAIHNSVTEGADKLSDVHTAVEEATSANIPVTLDEIVNSSALNEFKRELAAATGRAGARFQAFAMGRSTKAVDNVQKLVAQIGDPKVDKSALGNQIIKQTDDAIEGITLARNKNWEDGINELKGLVGNVKVVNPTNTINLIDDTIKGIREGRLDVKPGLEKQFSTLRQKLSEGLDVEQLQANMQAFRRNGKIKNENAPEWNKLMGGIMSDLDEIQGTNAAVQGLKALRSQYKAASTTKDALVDSVLGQAVKAVKGAEGNTGRNLIKSFQGMEESQLRTLMPLLDKYAPTAADSVRARTLLDALESSTGQGADIVGGLDFNKFVRALPEGKRFNAMFGDKANKGNLVATVNTFKRLARSQAPIRASGDVAGQEQLTGNIGGTLAQGINPVFGTMNIVRAMRAPAVAKMLLEPKRTKKLLGELQQAEGRPSRSIPYQLSKGSTAFLVDLMDDFEPVREEL